MLRCFNIMLRLTALLLILLCQGALLRAQDTESDNPTGPSGDFNGDVTTAGRYDPFTGNIKRQVTDLTVPGSNGAYPLAFSRTYNLKLCSVGGDFPYFGDGVNWRHSYQWTLCGSVYNLNGVPSVYTVAYPDGAVITFRAGRASAPAQETFWRGPSGTTDRLEVQDSAHVYLHTADGGKVNFGNLTHPSSITDPTGAITLLTYMPNNPSYLAQVTEPGGRWLKFSYVTATYKGKDDKGVTFVHTWTLLNQVQASNGQTVTYSEAATGSQSPAGATYPYYVLTGVSYDQETSTSGSGNVHASYGYTVDTGGSPTLVTAIDPHYAGAMVNIRYAPNGLSFQEKNFSTSELVSGCVITQTNSTTTSSTETRGDKSSGTGNTSGAGANLTRTFTFGTNNVPIPGDNSTPPNVKPSLLTAVSDFEGYTSYKYYYDVASKDTYGKSFLMSTVDARNNATYYQHEPLTGKVTQVKFADGRVRSASWRAADDTSTFLPYYLYQITDERGLTTTIHHFPSSGIVSEIDYPDNTSELYRYAGFNGNGGPFYKLSLFQNKLGGQITYGYDEANHGGSGYAGLLTSVTRNYAVGSTVVHETTAFTYDALDRVIQTTDQRGVTNSYSYNSRHQVVRVTHGDGTFMAIGYDDYGNCISVQDENGNTKTAAYDEYRRLINVTTPVNAPNAAGTQIASRYEAFNYLRYDNSVNVRGDALSNTNPSWSAKWMPTGSSIWRVFSPNGFCTDECDGMYVNGSGNPITPVPGNGYGHIVRTHSPIGQLKTSADALGFTTTFGYDACDRLTSVTDPVGHVTSPTYYASGEHSSAGQQTDCSGLLKSVTAPGTDASSALTVTSSDTAYDTNGMVQVAQDASLHVFDSGFDPLGDLISQSDGRNATPYFYDQLGRKTLCTYQDNTTEQWTYDASGNLSTFKNRNGAICTYQYDGRNRCTSYSWSDGTSSLYYTYYPNGLLKEASNAHSDIKYSYDSSNALVSENEVIVQPTHLITRYTHDLDGNVDSITYPSGDICCYNHDNQERVTGMYSGASSPGPAMSSFYRYTGNWQTLRWLSNGLDTGYAYQNNGRLSIFRHFRGDNAGNTAPNGNISRQLYGYAPDGQVSWTVREAGYDQTGNNSPVENELGDAYYYNLDGTLKEAERNINVPSDWPYQLPSPTVDSEVSKNSITTCGGTTPSSDDTYTYDAAGNRTQAVRGGQTSNYPQADALNRYVTWPYENNGNATNPLLGWNYQYNAENQLIQANGPGGAVILYYYDAEGRLCARNNNGVTTLFYYAGAQRIEERDSNNNVLYTYYYEAPGSDRLLCRLNSSWGLVWYLYDGQGNTTHLCDNWGNVLERYLYDAFGTPTIYDPAGNVHGISVFDNRYLFKSAGGYEWQPQAQLYYCRERFYLPYHGRWLQPDPIGQEGGLNLYAYCKNDPINNIDPSGLESGVVVTGDYVSAGVNAFAPGPEGGISSSFYGLPDWLEYGAPSGGGSGTDHIQLFYHLPNGSGGRTSNVGAGIAGAAAFGLNAGEVAGAALETAASVTEAVATATVAIPTAIAGGGVLFFEKIIEEFEEVDAAAANFEADADAAARAAEGGVKLTQEGIDAVSSHLSQFDDFAPNTQMVQRLQSAFGAGQSATGADANFFLHEASEANFMSQGLDYDAAHAASLEVHGASPFSLYAPEVIDANPTLFNSAWRQAAGF